MRFYWLPAALLAFMLTVMWQGCEDLDMVGAMFDSPMDQISTSSDAEAKAALELKNRLELEGQTSEDRRSALSGDNVGSAADSVDFSRIDHAIKVESTNEDNYLTKAALQVATGNAVDDELLQQARSRYKSRNLGDHDDYYFKHYIGALYQALAAVQKGSPAETRLVKQLCSQILGGREAIPGFSVLPATLGGLERDDEFLKRPECATG